MQFSTILFFFCLLIVSSTSLPVADSELVKTSLDNHKSHGIKVEVESDDGDAPHKRQRRWWGGYGGYGGFGRFGYGGFGRMGMGYGGMGYGMGYPMMGGWGWGK